MVIEEEKASLENCPNGQHFFHFLSILLSWQQSASVDAVAPPRSQGSNPENFDFALLALSQCSAARTVCLSSCATECRAIGPLKTCDKGVGILWLYLGKLRCLSRPFHPLNAQHAKPACIQPNRYVSNCQNDPKDSPKYSLGYGLWPKTISPNLR